MLVVIGDAIRDVYLSYSSTGRIVEDGVPVITKGKSFVQNGGASAVAEKIRALTPEFVHVATQSTFGLPIETKTRFLFNGRVVARCDEEHPNRDVNKKCAAMIKKLLCERVLRKEDSSTPIAIVSDYGKGAVNRDVLEVCCELGWKVIVDPHKSTDPSVYAGAWAVTPNESEAEPFVDSDDFPRCCVTRGSKGIEIRDEPSVPRLRLPALRIERFVDSCGAGDQFIACLGVFLSLGCSWMSSCKMANVAAGLSCTKRGTRPVTIQELHYALVCQQLDLYNPRE